MIIQTKQIFKMKYVISSQGFPFSLSSRFFRHVKNSDILTKQSPLCTAKLGMLLLPAAAEASYEGSLQIHGNYSSCSHDFSTWLVSPHYIICLVDYQRIFARVVSQ